MYGLTKLAQRPMMTHNEFNARLDENPELRNFHDRQVASEGDTEIVTKLRMGMDPKYTSIPHAGAGLAAGSALGGAIGLARRRPVGRHALTGGLAMAGLGGLRAERIRRNNVSNIEDYVSGVQENENPQDVTDLIKADILQQNVLDN